MSAPLRVGSVPYLVGRPVDAGLEHEPGITFVREVPARLVEGLREGRLDVACVSSIELFRRPDYRYLDGVAVVGRGFVGSVQVFLRRPIDDVRRLALDPSSRAAAALVRVLLAERTLGAPEYLEVPTGADPRAADADAWLRIGDAALREHLTDEAHPVYNPSEEWTRRTGLPFVFALWIVRPGVDVRPHLGAFARARARGAASTDTLAREAAAAWQLPVEACRRYLAEECSYQPHGAEMAAALAAFQERSAALDLCLADASPEPIELPTAHAQADR